MKKTATGGLEVDEARLNYYKTFLDHAKKFMMDFKVSNVNNNNDDGGKTSKGPKDNAVPDTAKGNFNKLKPSAPGGAGAPTRQSVPIKNIYP
jgi:hypothetical protein